MPNHTNTNAPRSYCEFNNGRISRRYLERTRGNPQHDIRTDEIGSRHDEWRRKDSVDLQCSTKHTRGLRDDRETQLWATNPKNITGVDPWANVVGWYTGYISHTPWIERKNRCYRRIRSAAELKARNRNAVLCKAYHRVKAKREAEEGQQANVLTAHEWGRLRAVGNDAALLATTQQKEAEAAAIRQKEEREMELRDILASLATVAPPVVVQEDPHVSIPITPLQMHPDRLAQLEPSPALRSNVGTGPKQLETRDELRRRRNFKARRLKAKLEGRSLDVDERQQDGNGVDEGSWQPQEYEFV